MQLALTGQIDGHIERLYDFAKALKPECVPSWLLCAGSFGTWPDQKRLDRGTRQHTGPGDFARLYLSGWQAPVQTLYVSGVHEDHRWLRDCHASGHMEVLNAVHWLANGYRTTIGTGDEVVRVTGFGKVFSESTFNGKFNKKRMRHYTRREFERACSSGPTDVLLLHEAPGNDATRHLVFATRPKLIVHAARTEADEDYEFMGVKTIPVFGSDVRLLSV